MSASLRPHLDSATRNPPAKREPSAAGRPREPLIPFKLLDAPSQRLYLSAFYLGLTAWRLYDYFRLLSEETDSLWLFMKWVAVDGIFLFSLPELQVPWLSWSLSTTTVIFLAHAVGNAVLMFRIPIPYESWILALTKMLYDREMAISEHRVKPGELSRNPSLILGKQIVNILPEGLIHLNPAHESACIGPMSDIVHVPILINQTSPKYIQLSRTDLSTNQSEVVDITTKECRRLKKAADSHGGKKNQSSPIILKYPVRQTGLYQALKVIDESGLEVHRKSSGFLVVRCPTAAVKATLRNRCRGDLSDFRLHIEGTPPLRVGYSKTVNGRTDSHVLLNVHPDKTEVDSAEMRPPLEMVQLPSEGNDLPWFLPRQVEIPLNETLGELGKWTYIIDEVHDGYGNVVRYTHADGVSTPGRPGMRAPEQNFVVHDYPSAALEGCSPESPLKVAAGSSIALPVWLNPSILDEGAMPLHKISYAFSPGFDHDAPDQEPATRIVENISLSSASRGPHIRDAGRYSLLSVSTRYCTGTILEPSSCLFVNPPEPDLSVSHEEIPHKCAGTSVGLKVSLDFIGTPPFQVSYRISRKGGTSDTRVEQFNSMRTHMELRPQQPGHFTYRFLEISDSVYKRPHPLLTKSSLHQDVKPTASASFEKTKPLGQVCIGQSFSVEVRLGGEPPWTLEYDIIHAGKREKYLAESISQSPYSLETSPLTNGGQHTLTLAAVTDAPGCRISLQQQVQIEVRHQRPSVGFRFIEGKHAVRALQERSVKLPLKLVGEAPWTIRFRRQRDHLSDVEERRIQSFNDVLAVSSEGLYELLDVRDAFCPGLVDANASKFEIAWIPRPAMEVSESSVISREGAHYIKKSVCEGDLDVLDVRFAGKSPFLVKYDVDGKAAKSSNAVRASREENHALSSAIINMDTHRAGLYNYRFKALGDQLYNADEHQFSPLIVQQRVEARPSARFEEPDKTYSYCKTATADNEGIPIRLTGTPPFSLEMVVRLSQATTPEIVKIPQVENLKFKFNIPRHILVLGAQAVTIHKVQDANGCQSAVEEGSTVYMSVVDAPSISPVEKDTDFCVGDRISFDLVGTPPFNILYTFEGVERRVSTSGTLFRRIAEKPGNFTIFAINDKASPEFCRARTNVTKMIHDLPRVRISKGRTTHVDIHEGGNAELQFEFDGTPPFEFTYTRSTNAARGKKSIILETRSDTSHDYSKSIQVSEEGTYEVVSIRDRYCVTGQFHGKAGPPQQRLISF